MNKDNQLKKLEVLGVFSTNEALSTLSISQPTLFRLIKSTHMIERVSRGLYLHKNAKINFKFLDYIIACKKFGKDSVIGGLSALEFYNLVDQVSPKVWVLTPPDRRVSTDKKYKTIKTKSSLTSGVVNKDGFKIVNIERALVEGLKFQNKIGEAIVFKAITEALKEQLTTEGQLYKMGKKLKMLSYLEKKWELLIA